MSVFHRYVPYHRHEIGVLSYFAAENSRKPCHCLIVKQFVSWSSVICTTQFIRVHTLARSLSLSLAQIAHSAWLAFLFCSVFCESYCFLSLFIPKTLFTYRICTYTKSLQTMTSAWHFYTHKSEPAIVAADTGERRGGDEKAAAKPALHTEKKWFIRWVYRNAKKNQQKNEFDSVLFESQTYANCRRCI